MMDKKQLQKVFSSYISIFNKPYYDENYKWLIVQGFKAKMDEALQSNTEEFPEKLNVVSKFGSNLLNNYIAPFSGLVYFARKEPETVRKMFLDLYENDYGDLSVRKEHMLSFLWKSHSLRDKYSPDSFLYEDNMRSVSTYIFLYDPDHNYIYIPTGARDLADCIEFYDEWGSGENLKLEVYYRMCDQLAEAVSTDELLMATDNSRYSAENGNQYYNDTNHHLLVCDFFYLTTKYHLLDQISYSKPKLKERENYLEKKETALELSRTIEKADM